MIIYFVCIGDSIKYEYKVIIKRFKRELILIFIVILFTLSKIFGKFWNLIIGEKIKNVWVVWRGEV